MTDAALVLRGVTRRFGSVTALDGVDFQLRRGEVHALLGENGAGKTTLMQIAFGLVAADRGEITVHGRRLARITPRVAKAAGIGMVHQHFTSIGALTVRENLWLAAGRVGHPSGMAVRQDDGTALGRLRVALWRGLDPEVLVESLPVSAKQRLEILQAIATGAEILLLDEPTALLAPGEIEDLLGLLRTFAAGGGAVVMISHKLAEVFAAADRVTVLRRGVVTMCAPIGELDPPAVAVAMVGAGVGGTGPRGDRASVGLPRVRAGRLEVRAGEVVGIAAVEGNGQRELLRGLAGGEPRRADWMVEEPVALLPGDRTTEGLVGGFSLTENLVLGDDGDPRWARGAWIDWSKARHRMAELIEQLGIRASGPDVAARSLSGGNQQKLLIARVVDSNPAVVIAENPTRGLDVKATIEVHQHLRRLADRGVAVLFYSTDLDEVLELADRIVVIRGGEGYPVPAGADRAAIGRLMVGG